ncbi:L-serine ammonia-lyase, iron-sulfur-dependent, subunit alpha [Clostridium sp. AM58-1XD]|uniref:L-cysteine desulfidase family protein n=1 Tax=Clostridium sp. AM58-1XD TaxID=2292307 RepID=UPI000E53A3FC|nr:L-serine ammonia-lyase, iron-sulfur-dependent, subunit alpha [Clostridium sp. AM58-1XD]RGZ01826.1 serine dehydratase subunit alpha family protein [Clostridium sp. AM58-1XD]
MDQKIYKEYIAILEEELVPAMGCTEPIALAYGAAKAREVLGCIPERMVAKCSGNIIKNVRCVTIPNSGGLTGIAAGVTLGAVGGEADKMMEVLENVTESDIIQTRELLAREVCDVELLDTPTVLHIILEFYAGTDKVVLEIKYAHTNITKIEKNGEILFFNDEGGQEQEQADRSLLDLEHIKEFADTVNLDDIRDLIKRQIEYNMEIAREGMTGKYGLGIGRVIMETYATGILTKMRSLTAAASEARMGGCDLPVIINSGSGNQGIASSVPLVVYARELELPDYVLYRALVFSNLLTIYQKTYIGKLSAFCGAVSASCASGAAITYMVGGSLDRIKKTIENTLANIPGIICDGAKISCAAKIASSLDAAFLAHHLAMNDQAYAPFTGIIQGQVSETIMGVGAIGKEGMKETDKEILRIMIGK